MRKSNLDEMEDGVRIGGTGKTIEGMLLIFWQEVKRGLMKLPQTVKKESEKSVLDFNFKEIIILSTEKIDVFGLGDDHVEMVEGFIFLGLKIE